MNTVRSAPPAISVMPSAQKLDISPEQFKQTPGIIGKIIQRTGVIVITIMTVTFYISDKKDELLRTLSPRDNT